VVARCASESTARQIDAAGRVGAGGLDIVVSLREILAMAVGHAILALILAAVAVWVLSLAFETSRTRARSLFVLLFLGIWAGGAWVAPYAPSLRPVYWFPFLLMAVLLALLIAEFTQGRRGGPAKQLQEAETGVGVFFWLLLAALAGIVVAAYVH
jgi:hypothetical protein